MATYLPHKVPRQFRVKTVCFRAFNFRHFKHGNSANSESEKFYEIFYTFESVCKAPCIFARKTFVLYRARYVHFRVYLDPSPSGNPRGHVTSKSKMADREEQDRMISEFSDVTGADAERARFFLESSGWQLHLALSSFFEDGGDDPPSPPPPAEAQPQNTQSRGTRSSARIATMAAYRAGEKEEDSEEEEGQAFYAGGSETSGQQILGPPKSKKKQTPQDLTQDIFDEARRHGAEEVADEPGPSRNAPATFTGAGYRLGDTEGGESQPVVGARSAEPEPQSTEVSLKFWSNGFSVNDGELRSFDDPSNKEFMDAVKRGEIPRELYRLSHGGEVHVNLEDHRDEEYVPPKKPNVVAFQGTGQKLGSPAPDIKYNEEKVVTSSSAGPSSATVPSVVDQSKPTTSIQIRLGDGTRLVSKFNHTQTVGDIRAFIIASRPQMANRPFVLMTTFPNKELTDAGQTIQDANLLNAVIVQRFK